MRTDTELADTLRIVAEHHFPDLPEAAQLAIRFGRNSRRTLGTIRLRRGETLITLTGHFRSPEIPETVVRATIAHELGHYAQGFGRAGMRPCHPPHRGGVLDRELERRGCAPMVAEADAWLVANWRSRMDGAPSRATGWDDWFAADCRRTEPDLDALAEDVAGRIGYLKPIKAVWWRATRRAVHVSRGCIATDGAVRVELHALLADDGVPVCVLTGIVAKWIEQAMTGRTGAGRCTAPMIAELAKEARDGAVWIQRNWRRRVRERHPNAPANARTRR